MNRHLLYCFLFLAVFTSALRAFSFDAHFNIQTSKNGICFSNLTKAALPLFSIDLITDSNLDDEENSISCVSKLVAISHQLGTNCPIFSFVKRAKAHSFSYIVINLSRIPRFNFLSLSVLRI